MSTISHDVTYPPFQGGSSEARGGSRRYRPRDLIAFDFQAYLLGEIIRWWLDEYHQS